ncbi:MAG: TRAP transporter small permease [Azospirillaceae bacterium]
MSEAIDKADRHGTGATDSTGAAARFLDRVADRLTRLNRIVYRVEEACLVAAMTVMLGCMTLVILSRYIRPLSLGFLSDLAVGLIPWVGLLGAAAALYRGRHIGMTLIRDRIPATARRVVTAASHCLIIAFLAILVWAGGELVGRQMASGVTTSAMEFPRYLITLALPVGAALGIVHMALFLLTGPVLNRRAGTADETRVAQRGM